MDDDAATVVGYFVFMLVLLVVASVSGWIIFGPIAS